MCCFTVAEFGWNKFECPFIGSQNDYIQTGVIFCECWLSEKKVKWILSRMIFFSTEFSTADIQENLDFYLLAWRSVFYIFFDASVTRWPAPTSIFFAHQFCWRCLLEGWNRFFLKNTLQILSFSQIYFFLIFGKKTSQLKWKGHFQETISFDRHSKQICNLDRFWRNSSFSNNYFEENPTVLRIWEILLFNRVVLQICYI